jgi:uncharacterized protein
MALIDDVNKGITEAMKARDQNRLSTLRMLKSALVNRQVEKGRDLDDAESLQVVSALVKQRRDSIEQFTTGGRIDLAAKEASEIVILNELLPPPLDDADLDALVMAAIAETGAASAKDMGKVMKAVMARLAGRGADGKTINELVRRKLS